MIGLKDKIQKETKVLQERLKTANIWALPRITKVVVNVGLGRVVVASAKPEDIIKRVSEEISRITGQKPVATEAKKAIASFKTRLGMSLGVKVTLHGSKMYDFLEKFVRTALPRTRDFRGMKESCVDSHGNLNVGLKDHTVFAEASADAAHSFGFQFTVKVLNSNKEKSLEFFKLLGFPFEKKTR
ncbi:MAG: 50S ribosomal protein L5 [bacterium]|nr:50S ribosomal protein L5 [bacterium]